MNPTSRIYSWGLWCLEADLIHDPVLFPENALVALDSLSAVSTLLASEACLHGHFRASNSGPIRAETIEEQLFSKN